MKNNTDPKHLEYPTQHDYLQNEARALIRQHGYSLLELLTVLTIVSILSAIAIPKYRDYTRRAYDERARADLMSVVVAQEAYFLDWEVYRSCENESCEVLPGFRGASSCVTLSVDATTSGFTARSSCDKGQRSFEWNSEQGIIR